MKKYFLALLILFSLAGIQRVSAGGIEIIDILRSADQGSSAMSQLNDFLGHYQNGRELYDGMLALDGNECVPDLSVPAEALMPTGCQDQDDCASCYSESVRRLNVTRRGLARIRCIYNNTNRFTKAALSFGDDVSSIHGASGLAWQGQRRQIEKSWQEFEKAYDRKYTDFILSMDEALKGINQCEASFGMRDWYQRFGVLYLEMMKEKYKRSE